MSKPDVLVPGRVYYDSAGNKVRFEGELPSGDFCLTFVMGDCEECGEITGQTVIYGNGYTLYDKPPMQQKHAELALLNDQVERARSELYALEHAIKTKEKESADVIARLKAYPSLRLLDEFMSGKIKERMVVVSDSLERNWQILPFKEALANKDTWAREKGIKLISFFGNSKGDLQYKVNAYSDGSGTWGIFDVVLDEEEGQQVIRRLVAEKIAECIPNAVWRAAELDEKYPGVATPEQLVRIEAYRLTRAKEALEGAAKRRVEADNAFEKAKTEYQQKWGSNDSDNGDVSSITAPS